MVSICGLTLFTVVIDRLGKRVAVERSEKWLKMLKVTCLPPYIHLAAKIATRTNSIENFILSIVNNADYYSRTN